jgi:hypothetical protein
MSQEIERACIFPATRARKAATAFAQDRQLLQRREDEYVRRLRAPVSKDPAAAAAEQRWLHEEQEAIDRQRKLIEKAAAGL